MRYTAQSFARGWLISDDITLAAAFLSGDADAHRLIDRWIMPVVLSRRWGGWEDQDDILQEVRMRICVAIKRFRGDSSLKTYVQKIAKYTCIDHWPGNSGGQAADGDPNDPAPEDIKHPGPGPDDELLELESARISERIVGLILLNSEDRCREMFNMRFTRRMKYGEIALAMNAQEGTMKSGLSRCIAKIRLVLIALRARGNQLPSLSTVRDEGLGGI